MPPVKIEAVPRSMFSSPSMSSAEDEPPMVTATFHPGMNTSDENDEVGAYPKMVAGLPSSLHWYSSGASAPNLTWRVWT